LQIKKKKKKVSLYHLYLIKEIRQTRVPNSKVF